MKLLVAQVPLLGFLSFTAWFVAAHSAEPAPAMAAALPGLSVPDPKLIAHEAHPALSDQALEPAVPIGSSEKSPNDKSSLDKGPNNLATLGHEQSSPLASHENQESLVILGQERQSQLKLERDKDEEMSSDEPSKAHSAEELSETKPLLPQEKDSVDKAGWHQTFDKFMAWLVKMYTTTQSHLHNAFLFIQYKLKGLPRYNDVPVFSEIPRLKKLFGEAHEFYQGLNEEDRKEFWLRYENIFTKNVEPIIRQRLSPYPMTTTLNWGVNKINALVAKLAPRVITNAVLTARQAFDTLTKIEQVSEDYDLALAKALRLTKNFLREYSNQASISKVSHRIRGWKTRNPSKKLTLNHRYQLHFLDLFGPGNLAKPDLDDAKSIQRLVVDWGLDEATVKTIVGEVDEVNLALQELYAIEEKKYLRRFFHEFYSKYRDEYKDRRKEPLARLDELHQSLLKHFEDLQSLENTFDFIYKKRLTERDLADRTYSKTHYELLPFIEPLRPSRKPQHLPDINPVLSDFGLHTSMYTAKQLMKLNKNLRPLLSRQYHHAMIATDFRQQFESSFDGAGQYCIQRFLKRAKAEMEEHLRYSTRPPA
ncbi:hypothetical protein O181_020301 [Austropuccinia psidii MF-1]|uniref:Uncharacterized protein n=1 Tax=Austropuccinia psidii MF-1 TaxID=1389203 RepID=A0A9Q3C8T3_9BASI|nr:hypothetical protein [Austropuccinia psidii MF-1]